MCYQGSFCKCFDLLLTFEKLDVLNSGSIMNDDVQSGFMWPKSAELQFSESSENSKKCLD